MDGILFSFQVLRTKDVPDCSLKRTNSRIVDANIGDSSLLVQLRVGRAALEQGRSHQPGARPLSAIERRTPSPSAWF
jgi:hypothetical protein